MNIDQNSYSWVIYKNLDDKQAKKLVNSYNYGESKLQKTMWTPNISKEERFKKKRQREDKYIENFHPDDRPVLLIKEKH